MSEELLVGLIIVIGLFVWFIVYMIARGTIHIPILTPIFRLICNFFYTIASYIPIFGPLFAHLIIVDDTPNAKKAKEQLIKNSNDAQDLFSSAAFAHAERERAEEAERRARYEAHQALEDDLRGRAYRKYGTRDVQLSDDGTMAKLGDNPYVSVEQLKKDLK